MKRSLTLIVYTLLLILGLFLGVLMSWKNPSWLQVNELRLKQFISEQSIKKTLWSKGFELVTIESSIDKKPQKAYFFSSNENTSKPLIVSLHTWGGNYQEFDSLAILCKSKNLNYIHPDFRGKNSNPEACGSAISISDIDDAIDYAFSNAKVDHDRIYVMGKSGGGYAAINVFMKSKHNINTISSWVPITDLTKWYNEGVIRKSTYPEDILNCTNSKNNVLNQNEARSRSPMYWSTPKKKTKLYIYTGIYDGIRGSVPITHSIDFYNKILVDRSNADTLNFVSNSEKLTLLSKRQLIGNFGKISTRKIILKKEYEGNKLIIFEGGHEMLTDFALNELLNEN